MHLSIEWSKINSRNVTHPFNTHPFNGPLSRTTRVSRYRKGKTNLDFTEARDSEWQWRQLGRTQVCTSLQTVNHASTPPLSFLQAGCPSCCPTNSVKALNVTVETSYRINCITRIFYPESRAFLSCQRKNIFKNLWRLCVCVFVDAAFEKSVVSWAPDSDVSLCMTCGRHFTLTRRRHHCRLCGRILCNKCSHFLPFDFASTSVTHSLTYPSLQNCPFLWGPDLTRHVFVWLTAVTIFVSSGLPSLS